MSTPSKKATAVFESRGLNGQESHIAAIKEQAAILHDLFEAIPATSQEAARLVSLSKTELESAVMWAVKATSRLSGPNA
jgi:hypothetical protein